MPLIPELLQLETQFSGESHSLMMRHKNLTINRVTSWWYTLSLNILIFALYNWFPGANSVEIHSSKECLSYLIDWLTRHEPHNHIYLDKCQVRLLLTSLSHLDTFHPRCQNGGNWRIFIGQSSSSVLYFDEHLVLILFDAVNKSSSFSPKFQVLRPWSPGYWSFGVERFPWRPCWWSRTKAFLSSGN